MSELEHGRYRLTQLDDGTGVLTRAVDLCDTCNHCGCGTQAQPVVLPSAVIKVLTGQQIEMHEIMGLAAALPGGFLKGLTGGRPPKQAGGERPPAGQSRRAARRSRTRPGGVGLPDQEGHSETDPAGTTVAR